MTDEIRCSFCNKPSLEVGQVIANGDRTAFICDECLGLSRVIVGEKAHPIELAQLHVAAFGALKGWGSPGPDGKWATWNGAQLRIEARRLVVWALSTAPMSPRPEPEPEPKEPP